MSHNNKSAPASTNAQQRKINYGLEPQELLEDVLRAYSSLTREEAEEMLRAYGAL